MHTASYARSNSQRGRDCPRLGTCACSLPPTRFISDWSSQHCLFRAKTAQEVTRLGVMPIHDFWNIWTASTSELGFQEGASHYTCYQNTKMRSFHGLPKYSQLAPVVSRARHFLPASHLTQHTIYSREHLTSSPRLPHDPMHCAIRGTRCRSKNVGSNKGGRSPITAIHDHLALAKEQQQQQTISLPRNGILLHASVHTHPHPRQASHTCPGEGDASNRSARCCAWWVAV